MRRARHRARNAACPLHALTTTGPRCRSGRVQFGRCVGASPGRASCTPYPLRSNRRTFEQAARRPAPRSSEHDPPRLARARLLTPSYLVRGRSGGFLLRLSALGTAQLFARQFLMEGLATIDANLAAFIFSAHVLNCGEPRLHLAKVVSARRATPAIALRANPANARRERPGWPGAAGDQSPWRPPRWRPGARPG